MLPKDMDRLDPEIRNLIVLLNGFPFIDTTTSCAGHPERGIENCRIAFSVNDREAWKKLMEKILSLGGETEQEGYQLS
ncbi:MAG TPA: hypothetical protein VJC03_04520, partial [bacterium]|nr:hypothetical protein [bacterium]